MQNLLCGCQLQQGQSPLHSAAAKGHKAVVKLLIDNGVDANVADKVSFLLCSEI